MHAPDGTISTTVDGRNAWIAAPITERPVPVLALAGGDLDAARLEAIAGALGHAHGGGSDVSSTFDLSPDGGGTLMRWRTEIRLSGLLGRFAGPGLDAIAARQANRTLDAVERAL